jgi:hypothetical protein
MFNLYEALEEKQRSLEAKGINAKDIGLIMSLELDRHFKKYILTQLSHFEKHCKLFNYKGLVPYKKPC